MQKNILKNGVKNKMEACNLPICIEIKDKVYPINRNGEHRVILDIIKAFNDSSLTPEEKAYVTLNIFYDFNLPEDAEDVKLAANDMIKFINRGQTQPENYVNKKTLIDWNKDYFMIADGLVKVLGYDVRDTERYTHWWTFVGACSQIGEGFLNTVVSIRSKRQKGKKLEKWEQEFYRENREVIDAVSDMSDEERKRLQNYLDEDW